MVIWSFFFLILSIITYNYYYYYQGNSKSSLTSMEKKMDPNDAMGKWYVIAETTLPFIDRGAHNATEEYTWTNKEKQEFDVNYRFQKGIYLIIFL